MAAIPLCILAFHQLFESHPRIADVGLKQPTHLVDVVACAQLFADYYVYGVGGIHFNPAFQAAGVVVLRVMPRKWVVVDATHSMPEARSISRDAAIFTR